MKERKRGRNWLEQVTETGKKITGEQGGPINPEDKDKLEEVEDRSGRLNGKPEWRR